MWSCFLLIPSPYLDQDAVSVRAGHGVHGVKHKGEVLARQELLEQGKVKDLCTERIASGAAQQIAGGVQDGGRSAA